MNLWECQVIISVLKETLTSIVALKIIPQIHFIVVLKSSLIAGV